MHHFEYAGVLFGALQGEAGTESPALAGHILSDDFGSEIAEVKTLVSEWNAFEAGVDGVQDFVWNAVAATSGT